MSLRKILPFILLLGGMPPAHAERVLLYGIQRGCQVDENTTKTVEQQLTSSAYSVVRVTPAAPLAQPQAAAEQVTRTCPGTSGRLLGGFLDENHGIKRVRLWLADLESKRVAVLDDYCTDCNLAERVALSAARLAEKPRLGGTLGATPTYCQTEAPVGAAPVRSNKLAVVVYGDAKPRGAVWSAVRSAVQSTGREVAQTHSEAKSFGPSDLRKMLREPSGQVLGVELTPEGASMWVFDGVTERTQPINVDCQACDREELGRRVSLAALAVLDTCFDAQCAEAAKGTPMRAPAEACAPFKEPACGGAEVLPDGRPLGSEALSPKTARVIKGLTWGAFAVSAASAIVLAASNPYIIQRNTVGNAFTDTLTGPAWTMAGVSAGLLAINIPITVLVNRAQQPVKQIHASATQSMIQCPN